MGSFTKWPQRKCLFLSGLQERKGWAKNAFNGQLLNILPPQVLVYSATYAQKKDGQLLAIFTKNTPRVKNIQFSPCALLRSTIPYQPTKKGEHKMEKRENGVSSARRSAAAFAGWLHTMRDQGRRNISCKYALRYADGILGDLSEAMRNSDSEAVYIGIIATDYLMRSSSIRSSSRTAERLTGLRSVSHAQSVPSDIPNSWARSLCVQPRRCRKLRSCDPPQSRGDVATVDIIPSI